MALLLDHNLSTWLVGGLQAALPGVAHVSAHGLERASDEAVWALALQQNLAIVTKDSDFVDLSAMRGSPPKVIWLRIGNCTTGQIEALMLAIEAAINGFPGNRQLHVLCLSSSGLARP